jgi:hypothetical protein
MVGVEVLHQHEGHASLFGQVLQQLRKGFQAARGGSDAYYGEQLRNLRQLILGRGSTACFASLASSAFHEAPVELKISRSWIL